MSTQQSPYGRAVRIVKQRVREDPPVGAIGQVLTEKEHGIERHPGYVTMTPNFPGIRDHHFFVRFGKDEPKLLDRHQFTPK